MSVRLVHIDGPMLKYLTSSQPITVQFNQFLFLRLYIYYTIILIADYDRQVIASGINEYHKVTCIRFVPRTNEIDYVIIQKTGTG